MTARWPWDGTLEEWLEILISEEGPEGLFADYEFPSDELRDQYIGSVGEFEENEVLQLLHGFLIRSGSLGSDEATVAWLKHLDSQNSETLGTLLRRQFYRRLLGFEGDSEPPWQGITWVLDLIPDYPRQAVEAIEAYFLAHMMVMPDGRIRGLADAQAVIRARWIGNPQALPEKLAALFDLGSRNFEHLVESLFHHMGHATTLTRTSRDGGRDVIAVDNLPTRRQEVRIECKLWNKPVGVKPVRELLGVVTHEKATKGIVVSPRGFTQSARGFAVANPRIELLAGNELVSLLDEHFGHNWPVVVDYHIGQSKKRFSSIGPS